MIEAYINGIRQVPGIDFVAQGNSVSFMSPPAVGAGIQIVHDGYSICNRTGNGTTFLFTGPFVDADQQDKLIDLLRQAFEYRNNTAVADAIEQLRVVVELVKQHER